MKFDFYNYKLPKGDMQIGVAWGKDYYNNKNRFAVSLCLIKIVIGFGVSFKGGVNEKD